MQDVEPIAAGAAKPHQQIPGPRPFPLVGNVPSLASGLLHEALQRLVQKYGDVFRLDIPPTRYAVVSHPDALKTILVDEHEKTKRPSQVMRGADLWGTDSFYLNDGERWLERRRLFNRSFRSEEVDRLARVFNERSTLFEERLDAIAGSERTVDARTEILRLSLDLTGLFLYGFDFDTQHGSGEYDDCLRDYWAHVTWRTLVPFPYYKIIPTPEYRRKERGLATLEGLIRKAVAARRERSDAEGKLDPLSLMLRANAAGGTAGLFGGDVEPRAEKATGGCPFHQGAQEFSEKEIRDQLMLMMQAGVEPMAPMLYWVLYELCANPEVQEKVAEEAQRVLGDDRSPDAGQVKELEYCEAVVRETTRLRPPVLGIYRGLRDDIEVLGWRIPKDWEIWMPIYSIQRDPRYWPEPDAFRPERWLSDAPMHRFQYLAFGGGPRICPGEYASMVPAKLLAARLCRKYRLRFAPGAKLELENGGFMQLKTPFPVVVERRAEA